MIFQNKFDVKIKKSLKNFLDKRNQFHNKIEFDYEISGYFVGSRSWKFRLFYGKLFAKSLIQNLWLEWDH